MSFFDIIVLGEIMKILLVEDNKSISDNLKYTFNMNNIDLDVTNNIKSTKDYLEYNKPTLIILDVTLPDGNGFDLYKSELSKMNIPVISFILIVFLCNILFILAISSNGLNGLVI